VAVIASLSITVGEALALLLLFFGQFAIPVPAVRIGFGIAYIALAVGIFLFSPSARRDLIGSVAYVFRRGRTERSGG
jgi:hypothetical protein